MIVLPDVHHSLGLSAKDHGVAGTYAMELWPQTFKDAWLPSMQAWKLASVVGRVLSNSTVGSLAGS